MTEAAREKHFRRLAGILLGALLALLLAEAGTRILVTVARAEQSHSVEFDRKIALARRKGSADKPVVLLLGNSYMTRAIYPEYLVARLSEAGVEADVRNLSVGGNTPALSRFLLETALAKGVRPHLVVLNVAPMTVNSTYLANPEFNPEHSFRQSYAGRCLALGSGKHPSPDTALECWAAKGIYLVRYRGFLRRLLAEGPGQVLKPLNTFKTKPTRYPKDEVSPDGWSPGYQVYGNSRFESLFHPERASANQRRMADRIFGGYRWEDTGLRDFQRLCRQQGIPLVLVWLPEHPYWRAYYTRYGLQPQAIARRFEALARQEGGRFVDWHRLPLENRQFYNPDHLNVLGALTVTDHLARLLVEPPLRTALQGNAPVLAAQTAPHNPRISRP